MPRQSKAQTAEQSGQKKLVFPKRITIRLDDDVRALLNASTEQGVVWASISHAANASMRKSMMPFAPEGLQVCISPFEQLVFSKRLSMKRIPRNLNRKAGGMG